MGLRKEEELKETKEVRVTVHEGPTNVGADIENGTVETLSRTC